MSNHRDDVAAIPGIHLGALIASNQIIWMEADVFDSEDDANVVMRSGSARREVVRDTHVNKISPEIHVLLLASSISGKIW